MKKKLALLLSAIMVLGTLPMTAFAATNNSVSRIVTAQTDTVYKVKPVDAQQLSPVLTFAEREVNKFGVSTSDVTFKATLENADWSFSFAEGTENLVADSYYPGADNGYGAGAKIMPLSAKQAIFTLPVESLRNGNEDDKAVYLPLEVKLKDAGEGRITIDAMDSNLTSGTYKFANIVDSDTAVTINDTSKIVENGTTIEPITITENTAGTFENGKMRLRLTSGFEFDEKKTLETMVIKTYPDTQITATFDHFSDDKQDLYLDVNIPAGKTTTAATISISGLRVVFDEDDVAIGRVCEIAFSGAGLSKATIEVGTATTYGITWEAENKTLPVLYSGRADEDEETLKATFKEVIGDSWLASRKTTITFPSDVKVVDIDVSKAENFVNTPDIEIEDNVVTLRDGELVQSAGTNQHKKAKMEMTFVLSVGPAFEGDIVATLGGAGIEGELEATVAKAVRPVTVEAEVNEVSIDYRKVSISDITITEAFAGALEKGKVLGLSMEKGISFDSTPTVEVTKGDLAIEKVDVDGSFIKIEVKYASAKEASTIKISGVDLFLQRDIPAGKYNLRLSATDTVEAEIEYPATGNKCDVVKANKYNDEDGFWEGTDAYFQNSVPSGAKHKETIYFDTRNVTVVPGYVDVVTAGRDQDDSTFTTQIVVQVGASTMTAGKTVINLDVPAYIKNGYTMLPVRAITEALSSVAVVNWDDATHTVTIQFGSRIIKMTTGSKTMVINGVEVAMMAECEITDSRAFVPLRDRKSVV